MEHEEWNNNCRGQCREPPYFAIEVHHGGRFVCKPTKVYTGGKTQTVHGIDPDVMSLLELDAMAQVLGYAYKMAFYYKLPGLNLDIGLVHITSDKIAYEMSKFLNNNRTMVMYLEEVGGVKVVDSQLGSSSMNAACDMGPDFGLQDIGPDFGLEDVDFGPAILFMNSTGPGGVDLNVVDGSGGVHGGTEHVVEEMEGTDADDSSSDLDVYYSDHSYDEEDDDNLYETYVDDYEEFVGVTNEDQGQVDGDDLDIVLSDGDSKYDSENSYYSSSDEENSNRRKHHFKKFRPDTDMADPQFRVGMLFSSPQEFKTAVKEYAIKQQRNVKLVKNDKQRIRARCEKKCQRELYVAKVMTESTYQVRTYRGIHNCGKTYSNRNVTSTIIAKKFMDELRINPHMPIAAFKERVRKDLKVDVSRNQLYKAKRKVGKLIYGTDIEQYGRLWDYCEELRRSNPGSTVVLDAPLDESGQPKFRRLYIFLHAIKTGFLGGCRQIVGVDGCHLKGEYSGHLLTAVGVDPNNAMYPMAWCVVENENKDTWTTPRARGSSVRIRGGGIGSQVFVPSNYDQATQGSQASTVTTVPNQKAGIRYANTNKLHGG
ncbi:hypothetical protein Vadar_000555 [Vaccinium darrowii]|uniref:Uncharacterized protein n=1 Tax=Vaccinium darrowii TaxID=229202 RepID=A0ACB7XWJ6_9ERIC|nr:hypothetical protein Vadar_000555 [Vaccinium darrowii]